MFIIFDTETTGLPRNYNAPISDLDNWPRVVQLAWQLHDYDGKLISSNSIIVKPEGFTIPFEAVKVHGISTERALQEGKNLNDTLLEFVEAVKQAKYLCGHNIEFDINITGAEFLRNNLPNFFEGKSIIDTKSDETTAFCEIPGGRGGKFKWPTLTELHLKLFGTGFAEAHNAAFDVDGTARCFFEIIKRGIIKVAEVNAPETLIYQAPDLSTLLANEKAIKENKALENANKVAQNNTANTSSLNVSFSHLHVHSQYSVLQATSEIEGIIKKAIENNSPAVALTDHGNMYAAFEFWQTIEKQNKNIKAANEAIEKGEKQGEIKLLLKSIIGCELNICRDRNDKKNQDNGFTQVFLAKNKVGYQNIAKLSSIGFVEGFYYVPRIDKEILLQYKEGLIATTGGLNSEIPKLILSVGETQAEEAFVWWHNLFGEDFYVELNRHNLEEENHVNRILLGFAKKYNVKYFAANSSYYLEKKGAKAHDILLCVKDNELVETPIGKGRGFRYGFANDEFYFKSTSEMVQLFSDIPEAIATTQEIVDKIENFKLGRDVLLPKYDIPEEFKDARDNDPTDEGKGNRGENAYLTHLTYVGAQKRYGEITPEIKERLDFELATIARMGFPGYFLIVQDFTTKAREMDVAVGPGRGSAAGSAIAYCLGITNVDPIKYDLLFERFLNPDRISMPDIDIDFDDVGRGKVIDYVIQKYGSNQVAQIITYGTMGGKSAIRDTARALNLPLQEADRLAKSFPETPEASLKRLLGPDGLDKKYLEKIKDRKEFIEQSETFRKLIDGDTAESRTLLQAYQLEGSVRNIGVHACGVIITPDDITKFVPVTKAKDSEMLVTQFDNSVAESAGLLKMDFLGLKTLTIIKDALKLIKRRHNISIDIDTIPLDDLKTYELFQRGETVGLFQYESAGMQKYLKELKPDGFNDLIAMNALYRPGPIAYIPNYIKRKHGAEKVVYDLEGMDEFLQETYGITVYQEQVMRLSQKLANFTKGDADVLRKAMGKKDRPTLDKLKPKFLEGCASNGHDTKVAEKVWTDWEAFASYAFNKSHSTCYALLGYQTAYLKAHYTAEFMAAVLTHNMRDIKDVSFFIEECKRSGLKVLGPDVNESLATFNVNSKGEIRFGMAAIKGVGEAAVDSLVEERENNGPFKSVFDLTTRVNLRSVNKRCLENLAFAGGFDGFEGTHRAQYFALDQSSGATLLEKAIRYGGSMQDGASSSQHSLFGEESGSEEIPEPIIAPCEPWNIMEQLQKEKEVLGMFVTGHPLDLFKDVELKFATATLSSLSDLKTLKQKELMIGGIVAQTTNSISKAGKPFGSFIMEDYDSSYRFMLFGDDYMKMKHQLVQGNFVMVTCKIMTRFNSEELEAKATNIELLSEIRDKKIKTLNIEMELNGIDENLISEIQGIFSRHPGNCSVKFLLYNKKENLAVEMPSKKFRVSPNNDLLDELKKQVKISYRLN
ncbi:MAG: DNA polymerase III subunit alpha [Bacteroidota bacterium]